LAGWANGCTGFRFSPLLFYICAAENGWIKKC